MKSKSNLGKATPAEIELHNWATYAGYVPANVIKAYEDERKAKAVLKKVRG